MNRIWYYIYVDGTGFLPGRSGSLQQAVAEAERVTGSHDDDAVTVVEITEPSPPERGRKKTGFFDKWGSETNAKPVGMPIIV